MVRIILDLDEVLTDFVGGACRAWDADPKKVINCWSPGVWNDLAPAVSHAIGRPAPLSDDELWARLNGMGEGFWLGLKPLPWFDAVLDLVQSVTDDWFIVTSPGRSPSGYAGKAEWLRRTFGPDFDRFAVTPHKHVFAAPETLLLDDCDANCHRFLHDPKSGRPTGGQAVVFPRRWNHLYDYAADPLPVVRDTLYRKLDR